MSQFHAQHWIHNVHIHQLAPASDEGLGKQLSVRRFTAKRGASKDWNVRSRHHLVLIVVDPLSQIIDKASYNRNCQSRHYMEDIGRYHITPKFLIDLHPRNLVHKKFLRCVALPHTWKWNSKMFRQKLHGSMKYTFRKIIKALYSTDIY